MPKFNDFSVLSFNPPTNRNQLSESIPQHFSRKKDPKQLTHSQNQCNTNNPTPASHADFSGDDSSYSDDCRDNYEPPATETSSFIGKGSWIPSIIWSTFGVTLLYTYYYLFTNITACNRFLVREDTWSTWKCDKESYETLLRIPAERLANKLMEDINTIYYQEPEPVKLFLEDIAQEYEEISRWIQIRNIALGFWLPLGDIFYTMEDRLYLLNHLRTAVHAWRAKQF